MRLYRALLLAYPASFRAEYGEEMCAVFVQRRRNASSALLVFALWVEVVFDVFLNAVRVHADILSQDLRYTARTLRRSPGFTFTAIAVASLGIGATTAAFTMVDHVLLRPLPFADQDRLVKLFEDHSFAGIRYFDVSPANYRDWKRMSTSFDAMGVYRGLSVNLVGQGEPERIDGASVSAEIFPILGINPVIGRFFTAEDDRENAPGAVVLSFGLWQREFAGDASVLGRKVVLDNQPYTVIGVMPPVFYFPRRNAQLWTAMRFAPRDFEDRTDTFLYGIARLRHGVSIEEAGAELSTIAAQLQQAYPKELARVGISIRALHDDIPGQARMMLRVLLWASACVLLVACMDLANLLLARALARRKELAVRAAMGAGRERLVRQMLTESLILAAAGGVLGILVASQSLPLLARLVPVNLPIPEVPSVDMRVLWFAASITILVGIGFGVFPALRASNEGMREGSRSGVGGRKERLRRLLVVAEVAGSVVLLVSCGLLTRALWRIRAVNPGFRPENVLTLRTALPMPKYERMTARERFYLHVLSESRRLPGVTGAAYISFLPMGDGGGVWPVEVEGQPQPLAQRQNASLRFVTPGFFSVMGIPLLAGRDVAESDTNESQYAAIVSRSFVRRYWPDQNPMGLRMDFGNHVRTGVGVVGDIRVRGLERSSEPQVYLPYKQAEGVGPWYSPKDLVVRAATDPGALAPALRGLIHEADPEQPVSDVQTFTQIVEGETTMRRVQLGALGSFAVIAFVLAAVGIHGLLSFAVSNRTQEIGVRIALGARRSDILRMILREGAALAAAGIAIGAALAYGAGQELRALLAGLQPGDAATFASAAALCFFMALAGSLLPALRAIRVDPTAAIRME